MNNAKKWLAAIFIFTLTVRLILAFIVPNFTYESYFHLRQVEHIASTGLPLYQDDLSYGGRTFIFLPLFHYLAALFSLILPLGLVAKILPNILLALLTIIIYLISKKISNNEEGSLYSAAIAGFLPILFSTNSFVPNTLALPLIFLAVYSFLNIKNKKYLFLYIISFLLASITNAALSLLVIGLGIYVLLSLIEHKTLSRAETELIIASVFFYLWSQFLFFKDVLIEEGPAFIWKNVPPQILSTYFPTFSIGEALLLISIVPLVVGFFTIYQSLFHLRKNTLFLIISFVISTIILGALKLIAFISALTFIGLLFAIIFSTFYREVMSYLQKTKYLHLKNWIVITFAVLLLATTVYPAVDHALTQDTPSDEVIGAFQWISKHTTPNSGVLALVEEGHLVTYVGERRNLMDDRFSLIEDIETRYQDLNSLYATQFETQAIGLLNQYNLNFIVLSQKAQEKYDTKRLKYLTPKCFQLVHNEGAKIYESRCRIEKE